ncbi:MAG: hypothetical protein V1894_03165 [Chloroflexota bacterium]
MPLPDETRFFEKFFSALNADKDVMQAYLRRFDAYYDENHPEYSRDRIFTGLNCYGGYKARVRLVESVPIVRNELVLDVGPEMGMECLLLAEVYDRVLVTEPDIRTFRTLMGLAEHYLTQDGRKASEVLDIRHAGIVPPDADCLSVTADGKDTGFYAFDARGAEDIGKIFGREFADRVYCFHLALVMPAKPRLPTLLGALASYCKPGGRLTWADSVSELTLVVSDGRDAPTWDSLEAIKSQVKWLLPGFRTSFRLNRRHQLITIARKQILS